MIDPFVEAEEAARTMKKREPLSLKDECAQQAQEPDDGLLYPGKVITLPAGYQAIPLKDASEGKTMAYPEYRDERLRELGITDTTEEATLNTER